MLSALHISLVSSLIGSVIATPWDIEKRGCGNNCARAVIASANPERPNSADCSSFLGRTVTPAVVTVYQTVTGTVTNQFTVSNTIVNTQTDTETITNTQTITDTITNTQTDVNTITNTLTNQQTNTATNTINTVTTLPYPGLQGRDAVPTIPAYASACKGDTASYSEACGCIGVTAYTITLAAPTTVIDVAATNTQVNTIQETKTDSATVEETNTQSATVLETQTNLATIVETNTQSATIVLTQTATATQTIVATVTAGPPTCVVQFPAACAAIPGKTGAALITAGLLCASKIIQLQGPLAAQIQTAALTCRSAGNAQAIYNCFRAAFQC